MALTQTETDWLIDLQTEGKDQSEDMLMKHGGVHAAELQAAEAEVSLSQETKCCGSSSSCSSSSSQGSLRFSENKEGLHLGSL